MILCYLVKSSKKRINVIGNNATILIFFLKKCNYLIGSVSQRKKGKEHIICTQNYKTLKDPPVNYSP